MLTVATYASGDNHNKLRYVQMQETTLSHKLDITEHLMYSQHLTAARQ